MRPVKFSYANTTFAKNQPEFLPLPAWSDGNQTISCWSISWRERFHLLRTGQLWIRQKNFGQPLQAIRPQALSPFPTMPMVKNDNHNTTKAPGQPFVETNNERAGGRPDLV